MVSLRWAVFNFLKFRRSPICSVSVGRHTPGIPYIVSAESNDKVVIGNFCSIAHGTVLITHQGHIPPPSHSDYRVATYPVAVIGKEGFKSSWWIRDRRNFVRIGNDVWIGVNAIILPGVTIGDGAIVGAGSIVTHDVPPYAVVVGIPARILRYRYSKEQINKLLKIAWWNWSDKKIIANMDYFYGKVADFIEKFYEEK